MRYAPTSAISNTNAASSATRAIAPVSGSPSDRRTRPDPDQSGDEDRGRRQRDHDLSTELRVDFHIREFPSPLKKDFDEGGEVSTVESTRAFRTWNIRARPISAAYLSVSVSYIDVKRESSRSHL